MIPAVLAFLVILSAHASDAPTMSKADCLAATQNFIEVMKTDPAWRAHVEQEGMVEQLTAKSTARCDRSIEGEDLKALRCMASAHTMADVTTCMGATALIDDPGPRPEPPPPLSLPAQSPMSQPACMAVQLHIFQVMTSNPQLSDTDRLALMRARQKHGDQSDARACQMPITMEGETMLRCLAATQTMPQMQVCIAQAREVQAAQLGPILKTAQARTERMRIHLMKQQETGREVQSMAQTPPKVGKQSVDVLGLPPSSGRDLLLELGMKSVHCTYAVQTQNHDESPISGGFQVVTHCDLDNDGIPAMIYATRDQPAYLQSRPGNF